MLAMSIEQPVRSAGIVEDCGFCGSQYEIRLETLIHLIMRIKP